jgi:hypothetical protein
VPRSVHHVHTSVAVQITRRFQMIAPLAMSTIVK